MGISAVIIAKDEADRIRPCLNSVDWAEEILVVLDDTTTDATEQICHAAGAKVLRHPWLGYSRQRQLALESAGQEWVLMIDADERVTPELRAEIQTLLASPSPCEAYSINRRTLLWGREIRCRYPDTQLRLFRRTAGYYPDCAVHEGWVGKCPQAPHGRLNSDLLHDSYRSFLHLVKKFDEYAELAAGDLARSGRDINLRLAVWRACFTFCKYHLFKGGIRDGAPGLAYNLAHAYYVFLKYARAYELRLHPPGDARQPEIIPSSATSTSDRQQEVSIR